MALRLIGKRPGVWEYEVLHPFLFNAGYISFAVDDGVLVEYDPWPPTVVRVKCVDYGCEGLNDDLAWSIAAYTLSVINDMARLVDRVRTVYEETVEALASRS